MKALSINALTKTYANGNQALKGINFEVEVGDFYALLGPNGAGKTTAIGIITSLVNKSGGNVKIFGHDIDTDSDPLAAGLGFALAWDTDFVGRDTLKARREGPPKQSIASLLFEDTDAWPLGNEPVYAGDRPIGQAQPAE